MLSMVAGVSYPMMIGILSLRVPKVAGKAITKQSKKTVYRLH